MNAVHAVAFRPVGDGPDAMAYFLFMELVTSRRVPGCIPPDRLCRHRAGFLIRPTQGQIPERGCLDPRQLVADTDGGLGDTVIGHTAHEQDFRRLLILYIPGQGLARKGAGFGHRMRIAELFLYGAFERGFIGIILRLHERVLEVLHMHRFIGARAVITEKVGKDFQPLVIDRAFGMIEEAC
ncbi:MAG TPA: hypothetical protein DFI00_09045 [Rhodospirillaceae bacterium]|nr:hypothetical protein [Alphaproteobacteria bacterium]OUT40845.1 MAG: hypothetical protein CBB62_00280 [Micavibrio sp. TMED2]HCI47429.1 hypothetical protein [Rhodospirillaceae bacterium]MAS47676.1 hypothetical protein [Alphaproteobacteria bacterium]MAX96452.1 hypothetical protein [Alphaproteobacteria bacterium]